MSLFSRSDSPYRRSATIACALLTLTGGLSQRAHAQFTQLTAQSQLSPTTAAAPPFPGADGSTIASPVTLTIPGNTLTFTAQGGSSFSRANELNNTFGFADGTTLLQTSVATATTTTITGPLQIQFANGIREFGFQAAESNLGSQTFTVTAYNGGTALGSFSSTSDSTNGAFAPFLGGREDGATLINRIIVSSTGASVNDFYVGNFSIANDTAALPEPSALILLIGGMAIGGVRMIRRGRL